MPVDFDELPHPVGTGLKEEKAKRVIFSNKMVTGRRRKKRSMPGTFHRAVRNGKIRANTSWGVHPKHSSCILSLDLMASPPTRRHYYLQIRKHVWKAVAELEPGPSQPDTKGHSNRTKRSFANSLVASTRTTSRGKRKPQSGFWGLKGSCSLTQWALRLAGIDLWGESVIREHTSRIQGSKHWHFWAGKIIILPNSGVTQPLHKHSQGQFSYKIRVTVWPHFWFNRSRP